MVGVGVEVERKTSHPGARSCSQKLTVPASQNYESGDVTQQRKVWMLPALNIWKFVVTQHPLTVTWEGVTQNQKFGCQVTPTPWVPDISWVGLVVSIAPAKKREKREHTGGAPPPPPPHPTTTTPKPKQPHARKSRRPPKKKKKIESGSNPRPTFQPKWV